MTKRPLPSVSAPTLTKKLPVSGITVKYRPFVIREQKALLLAQESKDIDAITETLKSVIESCTFGTLDVNAVPIADLAFFFVQLRSASVGPDVRFSTVCSACGEDNVISMSLDDIKVEYPSEITTVRLTEDAGIVFRLPTLNDTKDVYNSTRMICKLIDKIYDADSVYEKGDYTEDEIVSWVEELNESQLIKIKEFVDAIPELKHTLNFSCTHCKAEQSRQLEGLHSFFRLGSDS